LDGVRAAAPALLVDAREAVEKEGWWLECGWWQGYNQCQRSVNTANAALFAVLQRLA